MSKFYTNIDLQQNQLQNAVIHKLATAPLLPVEGQIYYNTVDKLSYQYDGTAWNTIGADELTVAVGSENFLNIANGEISFSNLAVTTVKVDTVATTLAEFIATDYTVGNEFVAGDVIILTNATNSQERNWIHNGETTGTATDFTRLQADLDISTIRGALSAGNGITYNVGTGEFSVNVDGITVGFNVGGELEVKDSGITTAKIADGAVTSTKLDTTLLTVINNTYDEVFGDGSATMFTITHNLNSKRVMVQIMQESTGETIGCEVVRNTMNTIQLMAFPVIDANDARVMIVRM